MASSSSCSTDKKRHSCCVLFGFVVGCCLVHFATFPWRYRTEPPVCSSTFQPDAFLLSNTGGPSILCFITTMPSNHHQKAKHIKATWAKRCDKYLFLSSTNDLSLPSVAAVPFESRDMLWNKTFFGLHHTSKLYGEKYDYFLKADDDTYVIVENLRRALSTRNPEVPLVMGYKHIRFFDEGYPSGGAGYVLSRAALRKIVKGLNTTEACYNSEHADNEDVKIGLCAKTLGIPLEHGQDNSGFHLFEYRSPFTTLNMQRHFPANMVVSKRWDDCCSNRMVSFHYITPQELYLFDYLVYNVLRPISKPES